MRGVALIVERTAPGGIVYCRAFDEPQLRGVLIPMETHQLLKSIQVGSHIKVQDGKYAGQTGVILERGVLDGDHVAVILTDSGGREITVRFSHVQESSEISKGLDALEGYELHDIVLLPLGAVAVVTYVASEDLEVLTSRGNLRTVRPAEITRKLNQESARNISLDSKDEHVRETDLVILDDGQNAGALATVVRAHRASLWLLNVISGATTIPCGGLFVKKSRQVHVAGDRATGSTLADTYMGLGKQRVVNEDQFNNKVANNRGRSTGRDPFVGRTVRICKGNYKGLAGIVTNAKSCFSSSLAEYVMFGIGYFNKQVDKLNKQKMKENREKAQLNAKEKLNNKNCDWIISNDVSNKKIGFDSDYNEVTIHYRNQDIKPESLSYKKKSEISDEIVDRIIYQLN